MNKIIMRVLATTAFVGSAMTMFAQMEPQIPLAPIDSAVRMGKLENGLTYYIRHNETPKGQADFFIAQKAGSILENDEQRGLAHFLEHMCFNGTKSFPGNSLVDWLETVGVKFGQNLNAYTSIDETVYNISSVPVARTGVQDSCLLILHDWANDLLLDSAEIEAERGVIHQEWRRSMVGPMRLYEKLLPVVYPDNKYGHRLPIGTMEVVDNFAPQTIRDYYEAWYRPDNQAIIVVGDIDVDRIEGKIKEMFSSIEMPENAQPREYVPVADTQGTIYAIGTDPEMPYGMAMLMFKQKDQLTPREIRGTEAIFGVNYITGVIEKMLNARLDEMSKNPEAAFANAGVEIGNFFIADTKDALTLQVMEKGNDVKPGLEAAYRELLRAARGGFTQGEYDRAKAEYLANLEKAYDQRNGRENSSYAREYARHFTQGHAIPGIEHELQAARQWSSMMPLAAINQMLPQLVGDSDNRVLVAMLPEKAEQVVPTDQDFATLIAGVEAETIDPYEDNMRTDPLVEIEPVPVKATVSHNDQWDATQLSYPNGVKVIVKPTKFKDGEILFSAIAKGGISAVDADAATLQMLSVTADASGLGKYTSADLEKYLKGKKTQLSRSIEDYSRSLDGTTTPGNLQTLMELIHMTFRDINYDAKEFAALQSQIEAVLANQEKTPQFIFQKKMMGHLYKTPAKQLISSEAAAKASVEETQALVRSMFANPADFTFAFVGDINVDTLTALADKYLGSLRAPRIAGVPYVEKPDFEITPGTVESQETLAMETPQTWAAIVISGNTPYTAKDRALNSIAAQILSNRLIKKIREEMGAVYSIGARGGLTRTGHQNSMIQIPFPMKPEAKTEVIAEINKMVNDMAQNVADDELAPIKEYMVKNAVDNREKNDAWLNAIIGTTLNDVDVFNNAVNDLNAITTDDVKAFMSNLLKQGNYITFILDPEAK